MLAPTLEGNAGARLPASARLLVAYVALCALSLLPFVLIANPPIVDFANHVARLSLACSRSDPAVGAMYSYHLGLIPNLAADIVNWPLCGWLGPSALLKAVTASSLSLIYFSGWLLQRKLFGHVNAFLLLLPAFAMNLVTTMGYINFLAGAAIALLMVAVSVKRERSFWLLFAVGNIGGLVVFFCHIFALALVVVLFFGILLTGAPRNVRGRVSAGLRTLLIFVVPLVLVPFVPSGPDGPPIDYFGKLRAFAALFLAQHPNPSIYGLLLFIPLYVAFRKGWVRIDPAMRAPLAVLAAYVAVVPSGIRTAVDIDGRTVVPLAYLFFASLRPVTREREITIATSAAAAGLIAHSLLITAFFWAPFSRDVAEFRSATQVLPAKALVYSVKRKEATWSTVDPFAYSHVTSYATLDRRIFNPLEFTGVGMQPLRATPAFEPYDTPAAIPHNHQIAAKLVLPDAKFADKVDALDLGFAVRWPERFDYVVYYHFGGEPNFDPTHLTLVENGSFFSILKVNK